MRRPGAACLAAAVGPLLLSSPSTPTGAGGEVGSAPPAPFNLSAICPGTKYNFTATSWDHTCGDPGDGLAPPGPRCRNFSNLVPMIMVTDPHCKRSHQPAAFAFFPPQEAAAQSATTPPPSSPRSSTVGLARGAAPRPPPPGPAPRVPPRFPRGSGASASTASTAA